LYDAERKGILLAEMKRYLEGLGYHAFTLRGRWTDLETHLAKGRPLIVGLKKSARSKGLHFAVLTGAESGWVWLNDPTRSRPNRMKRSSFEKQWRAAGEWLLLAAPR
jgi:ABC-type bacteriocin/lantibiotic exporter with double-glycine peptidase domain